MLRPLGVCCRIFPLLALMAAPTAFGAHIRGKIVQIGFPASGRDLSAQGFDRYRPGFWTPILVELNNDEGDLFEGILEAKQADRDGDQVIATLPIAIRGMKEVFIYAPAGPPQLQQPFALRVTTTDGGQVAMFDDDVTKRDPIPEWVPQKSQEPVAMPPSTQLLIDLSQKAIGLKALATDPQLVRELMVGHTTPAHLPDSVAGLQMVDMILWDDVDPNQFRDVSQQQALLEWVERGGTLVLGVSRNWELVSKSVFAPLLPARLVPPVTTQKADALSKSLMLDIVTDFEPPLIHCPMTRRDLASDAISIIPSELADDEGEDAPPHTPDTPVYASSRPHGRGRIVLVTAEMRSLLEGATKGQPFLQRVLSLRRTTPQTDTPSATLMQKDPFGPIELTTGFRVTSSLYFIAAFFFVVVYILVATAGSWSVLQRRKRVQYAWTVFAIVAAIMSGTSLAAVQVIRGIGHKVQQLAIVDGTAGTDRAVTNCYFGLKTATHVTLDLALPRDARHPTETADNPGGLMPLPPAPDDMNVSQYSAEARYQAGGTVGQLWNVPLRATLKQFQGTWSGQLPGRIEATIKLPPGGRIALDSWIENRLDTDLDDCYLLTTVKNVQGRFTQGASMTSRSQLISVYPIGRLARGKRLVWKDFLLDRLRAAQKADIAAGKQVQEIDENDPVWRPTSLTDGHKQWLQDGYGIAATDVLGGRETKLKLDGKALNAALMVMTTYAELNPDSTEHQPEEMQRSRGFELDRSDSITTQTALLVGFAEGQSGPTQLAWRPTGGTSRDWETIDPAEATTMYRFMIPISTR